MFNDNVNLDDHENVNGGHTIERHVGKSNEYLIDRLNNPTKYVPGQTRITASSTYTDKTTAEAVITQTLVQNQQAIQAWLANPNSSQTDSFDYKGTSAVGRGISKGESAVSDRINATTVLKKNSNGDFTVLTSYPK